MNSLIYTYFPKPVRRTFLALALVLSVFIFVQSLTEVRVSINVHNTDKIVHFLAYFILAGVSLPGLSKLKPAATLALVIGFGGLIEVLQGLLNTGRSADIMDFAANGAGGGAALLGWWLLTRIWRRIRA